MKKKDKIAQYEKTNTELYKEVRNMLSFANSEFRDRVMTIINNIRMNDRLLRELRNE